jgi:hypothetical protein
VQESVPLVDLTSDRGRIPPFSATLHTVGINFLIRVLQYHLGDEFCCEIPILNFNKMYENTMKMFLLPKPMFVVHVK